MQKILVLIDHGEGQIRSSSFEALALGQEISSRLGATLHPVILGDQIEQQVARLGGFRADSVKSVTDSRLKTYDPDCGAAALRQVLAAEEPDLLLMGHTYQNIDLAPKVAAAIGAALITDIIGYRIADDQLRFIRQMFRNKINAEVQIRGRAPWMVSVQSGAVSSEKLEPGESPVEQLAVDLSDVEPRRTTIEKIQAMKGSVDLSKAEYIVGVGRGIKKEENLELIRDLAEVLHAEIGASRPVVDNEWLERERQIGSSGQNVSPKLYVACGISGAIQHIVGMKGSGCTVAINTDPNAPIFNVATYGIVGDLFEILPALTSRIRELKG